MDENSVTARYQLVVIETNGAGLGQRLVSTLRQQINALGFDGFDAMLSIFDFNDDMSGFDDNLPTVGVWFGTDKPEENHHAVQHVEKLLQLGNVQILPIVDSLVRYQELTPKALHRINGMVWNPTDDPNMTIPAVRIQEHLKLLPSRRRLFISYFRQESVVAARQLHNALIHSAYDVFLDSCDVIPGKDFQEVLRHRLTESDLLILLYTPGTRQSVWVQEEIKLAVQQGIGILQLVWPGIAPSGFSDISDLSDQRFYLNLEHFVDEGEFDQYAPHPSGRERFKGVTLHQLAVQIEFLRAHSLFLRRKRLVDRVCSLANSRNIPVVMRKVGRIEFQSTSGKIAHLLLCAGVPDAVTMQEQHQSQIADAEWVNNLPDAAGVVYNRTGISDTWQQHLDWLNGYLPLPTLALTEVDQWLKCLKNL